MSLKTIREIPHGLSLLIIDINRGKEERIMRAIMRKTAEIVESIRGSFAIEGMEMSKDDERRVTGILNGTLRVEDALAELDRKYGYIRNRA